MSHVKPEHQDEVSPGQMEYGIKYRTTWGDGPRVEWGFATQPVIDVDNQYEIDGEYVDVLEVLIRRASPEVVIRVYDHG